MTTHAAKSREATTPTGDTAAILAQVFKTSGNHKKLSARERQELLQDDIIELILTKQLSTGDPLPTEKKLIEELGVGRNSLREALKVLEGMGVIEVRHGFGTFVGGHALNSMTRGLTFRGRLSLFHGGREALELTDVRQALEVGLISQSVPLIGEESLQALQEAVAGMEANMKTGQPWSEWDQKFHAALYSPLKNELLSGLLDVFWQVYNNIAATLDAVAPTTETQMEELVQAHRALYLAVKEQDPARASELMEAHFEGLRGRLLAWQKHYEEGTLPQA